MKSSSIELSLNFPPLRSDSGAVSHLRDIVSGLSRTMLKPPPKLTVSQWADQYRFLSQEASAESGQWETSKAEYQREMMDCITEPAIVEVTVMKSVRTGGTQAVIDNPIGYFMHQDPGPMIVIHPGKVEGRDWSKDHFDTMVRDTPVLRAIVHTERVKDRRNEILHKQFPGGLLYIIGSNSAAGFRQKTIQRAFLDDIDAYDVSAGNEGDQIDLARNRTLTYFHHYRKIIKCSNPTTRGLSRIEHEYLASDQRHYYVPCPQCNHLQLLVFSLKDSQFGDLSGGELKFDSENLSWCYYECENCHAKLDERYKLRMIRGGQWRKLNPQVHGHAGFHIPELISPFSSWELMAKDFLNTKKLKERLRVFVNQRLGETFIEEKTYELDEDSLLARREKYELVPPGVLTLTAGVDVQADRLECIIEGWGKDFENWFVDRRIIIGSPDRNKTWEELDEYLSTEWKHESGIPLRPWTVGGLNCICVDSGFSTENVYQYVKRRQSRRFFATKGDDGFKKPFVIDVKYDKKWGARFAVIGVDAIKTRLYDRLNVTEKGAGYRHYPERCNTEFFNQLTSERRVIRKNRGGYPVLMWELKEGFRNEVLDCSVMNIAAVTLLKPNFEKLAVRISEKIDQLKGGSSAPPVGSEERKPSPQRRPPRRGRSGGWTVRI